MKTIYKWKINIESLGWVHLTNISHALTPADDQALAYQEENYEEEYQYGEDQGYEGAAMGEMGVEANKGNEFRYLCVDKVYYN